MLAFQSLGLYIYICVVTLIYKIRVLLQENVFLHFPFLIRKTLYKDFSGKSIFLESCVSYHDMCCLIHLGLDQHVCYVNTMVFIKEHLVNLFWNGFNGFNSDLMFCKIHSQ